MRFIRRTSFSGKAAIFKSAVLKALVCTALLAVLRPAEIFAQVSAVRPPTLVEHGVANQTVVVNFSDILAYPPDTGKYQVPEEEDQKAPYPFPVFSSAIIARDTVPTPSTNPLFQILAPSPAANFAAASETNSIPSDAQGAAGPNNLMVAVNDAVEVMSRTGAVTSTVTPKSWFTSLSAHVPFDPRLRYDPYSQRWIMLYDDYADSSLSCILLCVSATNSPTGTWYFYKITTDATGITWMDFPCLGFNKNWIVVTGNMFKISNGNYSTGKVWAFDKSNLYTHGSGSYTSFTNTNMFALQPAATYDANESSEFMVQTVNGSSAAMGMWYISGSVGSESLSSERFVLGSTTWADNPSPTNFAPQKNSSNKLDPDDSRTGNLVFRNNYLWFANTVFLPASTPTRASVQWWEIDTLGVTQQHAFIDDSAGGNFYAYPSISVNSYNDALIGYCSFSSSQYASSNYSFRYSCDNLSTLESTYQYKAGQNTYNYNDANGNNRWGDYSCSAVDPTDDISMWTTSEYAGSSSNSWSTWWAEVTPSHTNGGAGTWTWTGARSTSWFEPCNWDKGTLPDASSDVVIPGGTTYAPTITGAAASCKTITLTTSSGGIVNIDDTGGGSLTVAQ